MTDPGFTISVSQNKYLTRRAREMHAVLTVTSAGLGGGPGPDTAGPEAAEVILVDCSGSMDYPSGSDDRPTKISAARCATRAAIDELRDGVLFAVVAGTDRADLVYPNEPRLVPASVATRADAKVVVSRLKANGGTAIGTWLTMADQLLGRHATAIRHAMLFTDGHNDHETPEKLGRVLDQVRGRFACDVRGIGDAWDPKELLRIASVLNGQARGVARLADMAEDFQALMWDAMRKVVPDVDLRLSLVSGAKLTYFKQVFPTMVDLTGQLVHTDERAMWLATGSWAGETRDYLIGIDVSPPDSDLHLTRDVRIARVDLDVRRGAELSAERVAPGQVFVRWTDDPLLSTRIDPKIANYTGQQQLANAVREGCDAYGTGRLETAEAQFGIAVRLATESHNTEVLRLLDALVTTVDGAVRLRAQVSLTDLKVAELNSRQSMFSGHPPAADLDGAGSPKECPVCGRRNLPHAHVCEQCRTRLSDGGDNSAGPAS